jgi:short-subunit dehydrogenase
MKLEGKVALITGASEGIGAACAAELARAGAKLSIISRSESALERAAPSGALITAGDLTVSDTRRLVVARTMERFGSIDILINSAGVSSYTPTAQMPMEDARRLMELNFFAPLELAQLVAPHMRARRSGTIVNISSISGKMTLPWTTLYSASKFALGSLTEGLRMELRRDGIKTMLVCPAYVTTNFQQHVLAGSPPPAMVRGRKYAISAAECAVAIRRGLERDARTVLAPRAGWLLVAMTRLFPAAMEARLAAMNGTA